LVIGLHTSPHMLDLRERFRVGGRLIPESWVADFVEVHRRNIEDLELSFFEATVGMAFVLFRDARVDLAIIEVGMGGRLDSTNIVTPLASVITSIGLDHTAFLGPDRPSIATEKAGIIKPSVPVVLGEWDAEILPVFQEIARINSSPLHCVSSQNMVHPTDLQGDYQAQNARVAIQTVAVAGIPVLEHQIRRGLSKVAANTGLRGRWDVLEKRPLVVADSAHNSHGWIPAMRQWNRIRGSKRAAMVLGVVSDKDLTEILPAIPKDCRIFACEPSIPRALDLTQWVAILRDAGLQAVPCSSAADAITQAKAEGYQAIYVGGSSFVVADALAAYKDGLVGKRSNR
jgi:dihydrofolate synthase / folylpolyglutamate synthase